tara:strand:- start:163 stop:366 length:204 start_codon:yes stop_codon:yes gene_type:complete
MIHYEQSIAAVDYAAGFEETLILSDEPANEALSSPALFEVLCPLLLSVQGFAGIWAERPSQIRWDLV